MCERPRISAATFATRSCAKPRSNMPPDDRTRLQHIAEAADLVLQFIKGRTRNDLDSDAMLLLAVVRALEIIGEAANNVSAETRANLPDLPWTQMIGMRHRLVHAYFDVNRDIVWSTATQAVPPLAERLKTLLGTP
ncbi:MAG TPA: DUF86 domain-containing protein [Xanthobacteraceae bacterium]|nr:DUF86 domain-containing protein [Xanthobacteraceae bacterium]